MGERPVKIGNISVKYGATLVRELVNAGYTISDFEQILEEPTLATCNFSKDNAIIGILSFYNLKEKMNIDQLADVPIDLVLLHSDGKKGKGKQLSQRQILKTKMIWTCLIHFAVAAIYFCIYAVPALFAWVQNTEFRAAGGRAPMGMVLLILPAIVITFIWDGATVKGKGIVKKILLSLWLILNVALSLVYLVLVDNAFTHRIF